MYRTIVLAYDGSRDGQKALYEGAEVARSCGAATHLLAVMSLPLGISVGEGFDAEGMMEEEQRHYQKVLDEGTERLRQHGIAVTGHVRQGQPITEISRLAAEVEADLIVVGHRNRSTFARWWHSAVGASLVDQAPCSILVAINEPPEETG